MGECGGVMMGRSLFERMVDVLRTNTVFRFICRQFACPRRTCNEVFADRQQLDKHLAVEHPKPEPILSPTTKAASRPAKTTKRQKKNATQATAPNGQQLAAADQQTTTPLVANVAQATGQHVTQSQAQPHNAQQTLGQRPLLACTVDGCAAYFEHADRLSEHLIVAHNLLYKDVETRSKMNLMFLEQIKHQMTEQYIMMGGNGNANGLSQPHLQQQQQQQLHHSTGGAFALAQELQYVGTSTEQQSSNGGDAQQQHEIKMENHVNTTTDGKIVHDLDS